MYYLGTRSRSKGCRVSGFGAGLVAEFTQKSLNSVLEGIPFLFLLYMKIFIIPIMVTINIMIIIVSRTLIDPPVPAFLSLPFSCGLWGL